MFQTKIKNILKWKLFIILFLAKILNILICSKVNKMKKESAQYFNPLGHRLYINFFIIKDQNL